MLVYIEEHIWLLVYSLFLGASLGALYDVFRVTRIAFGCGVRSKISHSLYNKKLPLVGTLRKKNPIIPKRSTKADSTPKKKDKGKSKKQSKCSASVNVGSGTDSIDRIDSNSIDETGDSVSENRSENRENSGKDTVKGENKASPGSKKLVGVSAWLFIFATDIIYSILITVIYVIFIYHTNHGRARWFMGAACALGFYIYYKTVGRLVAGASEVILFIIRAIVAIFVRAVAYPVVYVTRFTSAAMLFIVRSTAGKIIRSIRRAKAVRLMRRVVPQAIKRALAVAGDDALGA